MAKHLANGTDATWEDGECVWVSGTSPAKLTSGSFNSCVGLVLWGSKTGLGAVAHFAGGLGNDLKKAREDAEKILLAVKDGSVDTQTWHAWIFGGISLQETHDLLGTRPRTLALMKAVRTVVMKAQITVEFKTGLVDSHQQVELDTATGAVDWKEVQDTKTEVKRQRKLSF